MKTFNWAILTIAVSLTACGDSDSESPLVVDEKPDVVDLPLGKSIQRSLYVNDNKQSAEQYIRNYLLNEYGTVKERLVYSDEPAPMPSLALPTESDSALSATNSIEKNVDEADIVKAFNIASQDYLLTVTQPNYDYVDDIFFPIVADSSATSRMSPVINEKSPASLNLYTISETPSAQLMSRLLLNDNSQYIAGLYQLDEQIIVQSRAEQQATPWQNIAVWTNGKSGIDSVKLSDNELTANWSISFDGHIVDSRRIDSDMYVLMRHTSNPVGLEIPWKDSNQAAQNIKLINELDFDTFIPSIQTNGEALTAFALEQCYLPDDTARFLSGGIVFNYLAKVDLNSGTVSAVQCVLAEINQVYMNTQSLFLIDSHH